MKNHTRSTQPSKDHFFRQAPEPRLASPRPQGCATFALMIASVILSACVTETRAESSTIILEYNTGRPYLSPITTLPRTGVAVPYYDEDGFITKPLGPIDTKAPYRVAIYGPGSYPDNQTAFVKLSSKDSYEVFGQAGEVFDAISIDLAEYSTVFPVPKTIGFIGTKADGSLVRTSFITDGLIGRGAPGGGFETFHFPDSFQDLVNLQAANPLFSLDNLTLYIVPEPPVIVEASTSVALWPPNRWMRPITLDARVEAGAGESVWRVMRIDCNEPCPRSDMRIANDHTVFLRATVFHHRRGRVYTVWLQATDESGYSSEWYPVEVPVSPIRR